jgi:hypothetical protein
MLESLIFEIVDKNTRREQQVKINKLNGIDSKNYSKSNKN